MRYVILADQQIPWHDPVAHQLVLRFLAERKPDGIILSGDVTDAPQMSLKYPWNHRMVPDPVSSVRHHQRTVRQVLGDYTEAAPDARDNVIVPGNHDERFISYVTGRAPLLHAIEDEQGKPLISLESYFDAENLGYRVATDPSGMAGYPAAHTVLGKHIAVYHGWLIGNGEAGASAIAHLKYLQHSVIVGHTHRLAKVHKTLHTLDGRTLILVGVEAGTLARVRGGLGHTVNPNWQQGVAEVNIFDNGTFTADVGVIADNTLFFEGQTWQYKRGRGIVYSS